MYICNSRGINGTLCEFSAKPTSITFWTHPLMLQSALKKDTTIRAAMNGIITQTKFFN